VSVDIVLLGAPGVGKGTQAELLSEALGIPSVSTGELFRAAVSERTRLGQLAQSYIDRGELVPDGVTIAMVQERLQGADFAAGVIWDGFPRTAIQAEALDRLLEGMARRVRVAVYIVASEETLLNRLAGRWTCQRCGALYHRLFSPPQASGICDACGGNLHQRSDDTPETHRRRIRVYEKQTAPMLEHYRTQDLLVEIDGEQDVDAVQEALREAINRTDASIGERA